MSRLLCRPAQGGPPAIVPAAYPTTRECRHLFQARRPPCLRRYDGPVLRAILFDFNGVLVDDEPLHLEMFQRVLEEERVTLAREDYYAHYLGLDDRGCFAAVLKAAGETAPLPRLMRLIARKASYYQEHIRRHGYPFFPGAVALVRGLAGAGRMLGVVSGALREEVEGALRQAGVHGLFK